MYQLPEEVLRSYCQKKSWPWGVFISMLSLVVGYEAWTNPGGQMIFGRINLGIHELGHLVAGIFGNEFFGFLGGTLAELALPLGAIIMFFRQRDFLAVFFGVVWTAAVLFNVADYMDSAKDPYFLAAVPIWAYGQELHHDWTYLFTELGVIHYYHEISLFVKTLAILVWGAGMAGMGWLTWQMFEQRNWREERRQRRIEKTISVQDPLSPQ